MLKIAYVCVRLLKRKLGRLPLLEAITSVGFQPSIFGSGDHCSSKSYLYYIFGTYMERKIVINTETLVMVVKSQKDYKIINHGK